MVAAVIAGDLLHLQFGGGQQLLLVDAGLIALPVQQIDKVLCGGVAGGAGGKGAAAPQRTASRLLRMPILRVSWICTEKCTSG